MKHILSQSDFDADERPHKRASIEHQELHCFGMVVNLLYKIEPNHDVQEVPFDLDVVENSPAIVATKSGNIFGRLEQLPQKILNVLQAELTVQLFADYVPESSMDSNLGNAARHSRINNPKTKPPIGLYAIVYGPPSCFEAVGQFTAKCNLFLQHPRNCRWNVPYRNPHCLASEHVEPVYTFDIGRNIEGGSSMLAAGSYNPIDLFADTTYQAPLASAHTPPALRTELYSHQKQALTFMLEREKGWAIRSGQHKDIWKKEVDTMSRVAYVNTISGQKQLNPPVEFRGGLLIDAPGLGKTLSIISLILSTKGRQPLQGDGEASVPTTLLVVPKTLVQTWQDELERHVKTAEELKYCVYYGKDKTQHLQEIGRYDLLITTYSVVRLDWKRSQDHLTLHRFKWARIVLDEAHVIRVPSKSFAKSVCDLRADCRWAVTGTPIQNRLTDLFSLFKFLQCSPFDDYPTFHDHVVQNWKANSDPNSVAKLKTLVNCLSLRRPKTTVALPARTDETILLKFSEQEQQYYEYIKSSIQPKLNAVISEDPAMKFFNTLTWVTELRRVCNHGLATKDTFQAMAPQSPVNQMWNQAQAQLCFDYLDQVGLAKCSSPTCSQDLTSSLPGDDDAEHDDEPYIEKSLVLLCSSCFQGRPGRAQCHGEKFFRICNHDSRKSISPTTLPILPTISRSPYTNVEVPTKIKRLVNDLLNTPMDIKSVVFSGWRRTLDIIETKLRSKSIRCLRLDGTLSSKRRSNVLRAFRSDPDIIVLLATITCGGLGLDITAASRAYIMEPQWNPMSEAQALDRIHRIGQQKEVKTIRYLMEDSLERSMVIKLQERKQALADLTIDGTAIDKTGLTKGYLQWLKELVG